MYHVDSRRGLEVKGVEIVVCLVVRNKCCKMRVVVYIEYSDQVK
jgi:hypothetical protein